MEDPSRAEIGKEKKGREGREKNRTEGKGKGGEGKELLSLIKKKTLVVYTSGLICPFLSS